MEIVLSVSVIVFCLIGDNIFSLKDIEMDYVFLIVWNIIVIEIRL